MFAERLSMAHLASPAPMNALDALDPRLDVSPHYISYRLNPPNPR